MVRMTGLKKGTPNGQRNGIILQSLSKHSPPVPTKRQVKQRRHMTPEEAYENFPTRRIIS